MSNEQFLNWVSILSHINIVKQPKNMWIHSVRILDSSNLEMFFYGCQSRCQRSQHSNYDHLSVQWLAFDLLKQRSCNSLQWSCAVMAARPCLGAGGRDVSAGGSSVCCHPSARISFLLL